MKCLMCEDEIDPVHGCECGPPDREFITRAVEPGSSGEALGKVMAQYMRERMNTPSELPKLFPPKPAPEGKIDLFTLELEEEEN